MEIIITMLNGETHSLVVSPDITVGSLKSLIHQQFRVPPVKQRLIYENGQKITLDNESKPLSFYGLCSGARVFVLVAEPAQAPAPAPLQVFLKTEKGQTHTYDITPGETVASFKSKVHNREMVPVDQQRLIHEGKQMDDGRKLEDYGVKQGSTIFLTLRLRGG